MSQVTPKLRLSIGLLAVAAATACELPVAGCTSDLRLLRSPVDTTVRVGQSFTASVGYLGCGGRKVLRDVVTYSSTDEAVLVVNETTGRVTAVGAGSAQIIGRGERYGASVPIPVTVNP
jgi:hypothetical protein